MKDPNAVVLLPVRDTQALHADRDRDDDRVDRDQGECKVRKGAKVNSKRARSLKMGILLVCVLCCVAAVHAWSPQIDPVALAATLRSSGWIGMLLYITGLGAYVDVLKATGVICRKRMKYYVRQTNHLFCLGELLHVPGIIFIVAGVMVYGKFYGWLLAIIMAPLSVSTSFLVVRSIGGQPLSENSSGWTRAVLSNLDERPYTTIVVVRLFTFLAPGVNYALALTSVPFRTFFLASATGLFLPLTFVIMGLEHVMGFLGISIRTLDAPAATAWGYPPLGTFMEHLEAEGNLTHGEVLSSFHE